MHNDNVESTEFNDSTYFDEETILDGRGIDDHLPAYSDPDLSPLLERDGGFVTRL